MFGAAIVRRARDITNDCDDVCGQDRRGAGVLECWSAGAGAGAGVLELQTRDARREAPSMAVASGGGGVQHHVVACMRHQPDKAGAKDAGSSSRQVASETAGVPGACSATRASMCSRRLQTL